MTSAKDHSAYHCFFDGSESDYGDSIDVSTPLKQQTIDSVENLFCRNMQYLQSEYDVSPYIGYGRSIMQCISDGAVSPLRRLLKDFNLQSHFTFTDCDQDTTNKIQLMNGLSYAASYAIAGGLSYNESSALFWAYAETGLDIPADQVHCFMCHAFIDYCLRVKRVRSADIHNIYVQKCCYYIVNHLSQNIYVRDIAAVCGITPQYLSTLFRSETGITISSYIVKRRMEKAGDMLIHTKVPVSEISSMLTYRCQSSFTAQFNRYYGTSPVEYRKKNYSSESVQE